MRVWRRLGMSVSIGDAFLGYHAREDYEGVGPEIIRIRTCSGVET